MTPSELESICEQIARFNHGVLRADMVNGVAKLYNTPKILVERAIKASYPLRTVKQPNGRIALYLLKPGQLHEFYK